MATTHDIRELLAAPKGRISLDDLATKGGGKKFDQTAAEALLVEELSDLQERLFASGRTSPDARRILVVLQGMDTAGKGGVIRHAIGLVDPQGVQIKGFKAPTKEELSHHYLWRITNALPSPGMIGIFDRSHYEDVLVVRVENLVAEAEWSKRYDEINAWEADLVSQGFTLVKCFLHVSKREQKARLAARLERPDKYWKYNPGDLKVRAKWDEYQAAYEAVLEKCNTDVAPWYVIPADCKGYRNWAVAALLLEHLRDLSLGWPAPDFDVAEEKAKVAAS